MNRTSISVISISFVLLFSNCKKDNNQINYPQGTNESVNSWVLDSMKLYYYWKDLLPQKADLSTSPLSFFSSLKNSSDRFSTLINVKDPATFSRTLFSTFGFDFVTLTTSGHKNAYVTLVMPNSPVEASGLKRGDEIIKINGVAINSGDVQKNIDNSITAGKISFEILRDNRLFNLGIAYTSDRSVYTAKIFTTVSQQVGYLYFNTFQKSGIAELKDVLAKFKAGNVTTLILDLRYNGGGEVGVAALLISMIAPVNSGDIFAEYHGNRNIGVLRNNFQKELSQIGESLNDLEPYRLKLNSLYVLTGRHTASAAELLINNIKPYMPVFCIGETTLGKDMASFEISDLRASKQVPDWLIRPLVFQLFNAKGNGGYAAGLSPDIAVNELVNLPLLPFGDVSDPLVKNALQKISGKLTNSTLSLSSGKGNLPDFDSRRRNDDFSIPLVIK